MKSIRRKPDPYYYLAGPIRKVEDYEQDFDDAADHLRELGYQIVSPVEHMREVGETPGNPADDASGFIWDIGVILDAAGVVLLPGWQKSVGASLERDVAVACGKEVLEYDHALGPIESTPESVMQEAHRLVRGARQQSYGHPREDFTRTARIISAILDFDVKPEQIPLIQIAVKVSRECHAHKRDNLVDICGYAGTGELMYDD